MHQHDHGGGAAGAGQPLDDLGRLTLERQKDPRTVVTDDKAGMFAAVEGDVLVPRPGARLAATRYEDWLSASR